MRIIIAQSLFLRQRSSWKIPPLISAIGIKKRMVNIRRYSEMTSGWTFGTETMNIAANETEKREIARAMNGFVCLSVTATATKKSHKTVLLVCIKKYIFEKPI